ncbi:hypothetical protein, partial [Rhizobium sp. CFBP 13717]|uniref:hypothetical protein n=1 Tax=Rhizobium sp. CFBP 13717 TaxID=2775305 RepID=UPI001A91D25D
LPLFIHENSITDQTPKGNVGAEHRLPITRTWPTLCNPGQRRAGQALIAYRGSKLDADTGSIFNAD